MSAMLPIATEFCGAAKLRDVPLATDAPQQTTSLFDHLGGGREQGLRNSEAECLRSLEVEHQFEFGRRPRRNTKKRLC